MAKPDPLLQQATSLVNASYAPTLAELARQRKEAEAEAALRQQNLAGFTKAYAQLLQPQAGQVSDAYHQAAQDTTAAASGFSQGMQDALQGSADRTNEILKNAGAPEGQMIHPTSGPSDVLYGLQGYIPGRELANSGAAFSSAAAFLPATAVGRGQQLAFTQSAADRKADRELQAKIREVEAEKPGAIQKARQEFADFQLKQRAQKLNEAIAIDKLGIDKKRLGLETERVKETRYQHDQANKQAWARIGLSSRQVRVAEQRERRNARAPKKGGFTVSQRQKLREKATTLAEDFYYGVLPKKRYDAKTQSWIDVPNTGKSRVRYDDALRSLVNKGIPTSMAVNILNSYYQPGELGRMLASPEDVAAAEGLGDIH